MQRWWRIWCVVMMVWSMVVLAGCSFTGPDAKEEKPKSEVTYTKMVVPQRLPVLMYHKIGPEEDNDAVLREEAFRKQMEYLHAQGYHTLTMEELYAYVTKGQPVPEKSVVLTFDDGYADTYTIVMPLLKQLGLHATVFINPGDIGQRLTWMQVKEMQANGMTIANHGYLHEDMGAMSEQAQFLNIENGQKALHSQLGIDNIWFCYPYGRFNEATARMAMKNNIAMALAMRSGYAQVGDNPYDVPRVWIGNSITMDDFIARIEGRATLHP